MTHSSPDDTQGWDAKIEALLPPSPTSDEAPLLLITDDEEHILSALTRLFRRIDARILTALNGQDALDILRHKRVAVLISDQIMPGLTGAELLQRAEHLSPHTVRIMLTGNNDIMTAVEAVNRGEVFRFVTKPWKNKELLHIINDALAHHTLLVEHDAYQQLLVTRNDHLTRINTLLDERVTHRTRELFESREQIRALYDELENSFDETLRGLLTVMELGDIRIADHCRRTADRANLFAEHLGMSEPERRTLERAALLHWIGLISAPSDMLRKPPQRFDEEEQAAWEFHPLLGHQTLARIPALAPSALIILNYMRRHEDDTFRPGGPAGTPHHTLTETLILTSKILALCSTFELHAHAPNSANSPNTIERLNAESGTRFDPNLLHLFRTFLNEHVTDTETTQQEREVSAEELEPGMVLARTVETVQHIPVAPLGHVLDGKLIERLRRFAKTAGLAPVYIWV